MVGWDEASFAALPHSIAHRLSYGGRVASAHGEAGNRSKILCDT